MTPAGVTAVRSAVVPTPPAVGAAELVTSAAIAATSTATNVVRCLTVPSPESMSCRGRIPIARGSNRSSQPAVVHLELDHRAVRDDVDGASRLVEWNSL